MKIFYSIINIGTRDPENSEVPRIRLVNGINLFAMFMVSFYFICYLTIFPSRGAALCNACVLTGLLFLYFLTARGHFIIARIGFGIIFMVQFFVLTIFIFSRESGIHLYYIAIAPVSFLLFDSNNRTQRYVIYVFSLISMALFYYCEFYPDIVRILTKNELHYIISAISLIVTLFVTSWIFTKEMNRATRQLNVLATTDALSGLLNRRSFFLNGERILHESSADKKPFALILLDLDHFKNINDTYGHPAGDKIIQKFSSTTKNILRTSDIFARLGGEEFGIILPGTDERGARRVAEEIRSIIENKKIKIDRDKTISCTVSIGITLGSGNERDFDTLLANCDKALYVSKNEGRNRCSFFV